jgi:hypothetical protein
MRHFVLAALAAIVIALVLVLVLGEEEAGEDTTPTTITETDTASPQTETAPASQSGETESDEVERVERAVALYVEAAERGEVDAEGLPTTDELSIESVNIFPSLPAAATAFLAGGTQVGLSKRGGRWRVVQVRPGRTRRPTPPSNG